MLLDYVNKISLFIFIGTTLFFLYELRGFLKEYKRKKIDLPGFSEEEYKKKAFLKATPLKIQPKKVKRADIKIILPIIGILFSIGSFSFLVLTNTRSSSAKEEISPIVKTVESKGIEIFDKNWQKLTEDDLSKLKPGDKIFIGIYKPPLSDIDKARIRINSKEWKAEDETSNFNQQYNVFYIEYIISGEEQGLVIEAQLHSKKTGWLID